MNVAVNPLVLIVLALVVIPGVLGAAYAFRVHPHMPWALLLVAGACVAPLIAMQCIVTRRRQGLSGVPALLRKLDWRSRIVGFVLSTPDETLAVAIANLDNRVHLLCVVPPENGAACAMIRDRLAAAEGSEEIESPQTNDRPHLMGWELPGKPSDFGGLLISLFTDACRLKPSDCILVRSFPLQSGEDGIEEMLDQT